jgi:hypothetical protein
MFITMGMWGEKITFIFKEKNFFLSAGNRRKIGGIWGWGGNRYKL